MTRKFENIEKALMQVLGKRSMKEDTANCADEDLTESIKAELIEVTQTGEQIQRTPWWELTMDNIPVFILGCTVIGGITEIAAYFCGIPWYLPVLLYGSLIIFSAMKFENLRKEKEGYI